MGRRPKAPHIKLRAGNAGHRKRASLKLQAARGQSFTLDPPEWLASPLARGIWARIAPELLRLRFLAPVDADVFGRYCFHFAKWLELSAQVEGREEIETPMTGHTPENPKMMVRLNPLLKRIDAHEARLVELEDRFGGNPIARYRLIAQAQARPGAMAGLFAEEAPPASAPQLEPSAAPSDPPPAPPAATSPFGFGTRHLPN